MASTTGVDVQIVAFAVLSDDEQEEALERVGEFRLQRSAETETLGYTPDEVAERLERGGAPSAASGLSEA